MLTLRAVVVGGCLWMLAGAAWADGGCGLDARNRYNVPLPEIAADVMPVAMAAALRRGFDLVSVQFAGAEGETVLKGARERAVAAHNVCGEALAEFGLGQTARNHKLSEAMPHFLRAQELLQTVGTPMALANVHERVATTAHLIGDNATYKKLAPTVSDEFEKAGDEAAVIKGKSLALELTEQVPNPAGQEALYRALDSVHAANVTAVRGYVGWQWALASRRGAGFAMVMARFNKALADLTECDCEPQTKASIYLSLAAASDVANDADAVLEYALKADAIYRKDHFDALRPLSMRLIAAAYAHQHDWPKAVAEYEAAMRLAREEKAVYMLPTLGLEAAAAYGEAGQPAKGLALLAEVSPKNLSPAQKCGIDARTFVLESQEKLYADAETHGQKVMAGCKELMQPSDMATYTAQFAAIELHEGKLEAALASAREASAGIDARRGRLESSDRAMAAFNEQQTATYSVLISALVKLGKPEEALMASEQFRARAFVDLASSRSAAAPAAPPVRGRPAALRSEVHPFTLTAADVRKVLEAQHATLVSYWIADDRLYTWVMAPGKPVVEKDQALNAVQLAALVRATLPGEGEVLTRGARVLTRGGTSQVVGARSRKPWHDLYALLIAPIASELPTENGSLLTIVPQGALFELSFPALMDAQNHYLIEQYAMNTAPSAGALQVTAKNDSVATALPARYVVVANPAHFPEVDGVALPPLPGTEAEARGIMKQLGSRPVTLLEGKDAGIDTLTGALPQATMLHLATHAVVSDVAPSTSFLALDSRQEGGKLTAAQVYGLKLHANLVVLSACSTGRGKISGDGVAGLSRAFLYAGAASLVTTLWDVVDAPTAELMPKFYAGLAKGESRSAALREAQLALIQDLRLHKVRVKTLAGTMVGLPETPAYWAAFSLAGQP